MKANRISAVVMAALILSALGCKTEFIVNGQGWATVHLKDGEEVTWTAEHQGDQIQIEFQGAFDKPPCKEHAGTTVPDNPAPSVTCTLRLDSKQVKTLSYQIKLVENITRAKKEVAMTTVYAAGQAAPQSQPVKDCHYCDVIVGKGATDQTPTNAPSPPTQGHPTPLLHATVTTAPSGIHFSCANGASVIAAAEQIVTLESTDLPAAKTWIPINTSSSWAVTFANSPCDEGAQLSSTDAKNFRCTITKPNVGGYVYALAAHGCTANGSRDQVVQGRIDISGAAAPSDALNQ